MPVLDGIESHAARLSVFLSELAVTVGAGHFNFDGALVYPDKTVRPLVASIGEANLIGADFRSELGEHVGVVKELELGLEEEVRISITEAERLLDFLEGSRRLPSH
jgi:hypothetical protein